MQVPGAALSSVGRRYSSIIGGLTVAKHLAARLLPDGARTVRMWRQFLPIYVRCKWTAWRYQEAKGHSAQVCASCLCDTCTSSRQHCTRSDRQAKAHNTAFLQPPMMCGMPHMVLKLMRS